MLGHLCAEGNSGAGAVTSDDLINFCRKTGLAGFKIPRVFILQRKALPLNSSGKVVKQQVKQVLLDATRPDQPKSRL